MSGARTGQVRLACLLLAGPPLSLLMLTPGAQAQQAGVTTIDIADKVLVPEVLRLGINTCGDNYWDSAVTKIRAADNFEGVMYRMISWGPELDENGLAVWFRPDEEAWDAMKGKVRFTLLGPPNKGTTGVIADIATKRIRDGREITYLIFDRKVTPSNLSKNGILLAYESPDQGSIRQTDNAAFWNSEQNTAHIGDVPPGSFGNAALWLRGSEQRAHYTYVPMWANQAAQNGTWHVRFWAKRRAGDPNFRVEVDGAPNQAVAVDDTWREHDLAVQVAGLAADRNVAIRLAVTEGDVLVDDVVIWKEEEHRNPTPFRDPVVDLIQELRPGTLRMLQMGGSNFENNIRPPLRQMRWSRDFRDLVRGARNRASYYRLNLHDFYVLCEYVGANPWYCLPGTLHPDEVNQFMEYVGAPADVGLGKARADAGHPRAWKDVFNRIYVEFGNEAWNPGGYATGSFNGPDHWRDMIEVGKSSAYYRPNIVFVAGSQAGSTWVTQQLLQDVPNADTYAIAPYLMNGTRASQIAHLGTDDELFRFTFAYTLRRVLEPVGRVYQHWQLTHEAGKDLAIYEHNFHLTNPRPDENDAVPVERRNALQTSLGGGLNVVNDALLMLRERGIQPQCLFNLNQRGYLGGIRLWGFVPGIDINDQRYRPHFLAAKTANQIMGGEMLETAQSGENPTFSATGYFEDDREKPQTYENVPTIWSYAFREGTRRGLIAFNLDTLEARNVIVRFRGGAAGSTARRWLLAAGKITANNEPEHEPEVRIREDEVRGFDSGRSFELPPFSMLALAWEAAE